MPEFARKDRPSGPIHDVDATRSESAQQATGPVLGDLFEPKVTAPVYLAALRRGRITTEDLVRLGHSPSDIAQGLELLVRRRLIRESPDGGWVANPPGPAVGGYASRLEEQARTLRGALAGLEDVYRSAAASGGREAPTGIEPLTTEDEVGEAINDLYAGARRQVLSMRSAGPRVERELDEPLDGPFVNLAGDRIAVRTVYDTDLLSDPRLPQLVRDRMTSRGEEVRFISRIPFSVSVNDAGLAVLDIPDPEVGTAGLRVTHRGVNQLISRVIEARWEIGIPWKAGSARRGDDLLDDRDRQILDLMASGASDASIARGLQISQRTVERRCQLLMARLDAQTRFQAGVAAARRGWL